jgi:hypothetical protein
VEHKDITDPNIHEVKGASTATAGHVLTATGSGTATFQAPTVYSNVEVGSYRIVNSSATPVALTSADTYYTLTNDALGTGTDATYGIDGVTDIWDETNSYFSFNDFTLGDLVLVHVDVEVVTTSANTAIDVDLELGIGATTTTIPMITQANIKTASTVRFTAQRWIVLRDSNIKDYSARIKAKADTTGATALLKEVGVGVITRG